jgi:hypothetical protein
VHLRIFKLLFGVYTIFFRQGYLFFKKYFFSLTFIFLLSFFGFLLLEFLRDGLVFSFPLFSGDFSGGYGSLNRYYFVGLNVGGYMTSDHGCMRNTAGLVHAPAFPNRTQPVRRIQKHPPNPLSTLP